MKKYLMLLLIILVGGCMNARISEGTKISLKGNPSTGYEWTCQVSDEGIISLIKEYVEDEHEANMVGVGGVYNFTLKGLKSGNTTLTCKYARSWEQEAINTKTYDINVDDNLDVTYNEK